jgi:hypothetical protein
MTRRKPFAPARQPAADDLELARTADVEGESTPLAEDLELQGVSVSVGDAGDAQVAGRAVRETHREGSPIVVLDGSRCSLTSTRACPTNVPQRQRALGDDGAQRRAGHRFDRAEQELRRVGQVAAQVGQRPGTGAAAVAPAHRRLRVAAVVVQYCALMYSGRPSSPDAIAAGRGDPGVRRKVNPTRATTPRPSTASIIAWASAEVGPAASRTGRACRRGQLLDDLAVQVVGDHHAHHVDVVGLDDRLPARVAALEAVRRRGVGGQLLVDVRDRHRRTAAGRRRRPCRPTGTRARGPARHARADDGDPDVTTHESSRSDGLFRATSSC